MSWFQVSVSKALECHCPAAGPDLGNYFDFSEPHLLHGSELGFLRSGEETGVMCHYLRGSTLSVIGCACFWHLMGSWRPTLGRALRNPVHFHVSFAKSWSDEENANFD